VFGSVRALCIIAAFLASGASPGHAQTDLTIAKQSVRECVVQVRQDATRRENYDQSGQPPMWRNFDAYISPDGRVHNNAKFLGEQDGGPIALRLHRCSQTLSLASRRDLAEDGLNQCERETDQARQWWTSQPG
jgi:hypothetical protein